MYSQYFPGNNYKNFMINLYFIKLVITVLKSRVYKNY